ncbi:MAG: ABC transporter permease [Tannerellaceae bacterium]|nr:ABC transporter permease [Tannerellaceae bacterium]
MSTYFVQQRSREIAVRKVFGSSNKEILVKLIANFLNFVGLAFLLALPVIWYLGQLFLKQYDYRISFSPLIFIGAGLICLLISFLTVFWQSYKAANENPAISVKTE